jgi:hypothetical protein
MLIKKELITNAESLCAAEQIAAKHLLKRGELESGVIINVI